jgi:hypothetical protein
MCPGTTLVCDDSVNFFSEWAKTNNVLDVVYLDSYDLDFYNPLPSANHGLREYKALLPVIKNTLLLIDDTPVNPYWLDERGSLYNSMCSFYDKNHYLPGKGMLVLNEIDSSKKLLHNYQVLYKL